MSEWLDILNLVVLLSLFIVVVRGYEKLNKRIRALEDPTND